MSQPGWQPELELDVVRIPEDDHRADGSLGCRREHHVRIAKPLLPARELSSGGHRKREVVETGAELIEHAVRVAQILAQPDDPAGLRMRQHPEPNGFVVTLNHEVMSSR